MLVRYEGSRSGGKKPPSELMDKLICRNAKKGVHMLANALELRAECVRKKLTLAGLATRIGVNEATLHRKIKGDSDFSRNELQIIRDVLKLDDNRFIDIFFNE